MCEHKVWSSLFEFSIELDKEIYVEHERTRGKATRKIQHTLEGGGNMSACRFYQELGDLSYLLHQSQISLLQH